MLFVRTVWTLRAVKFVVWVQLTNKVPIQTMNLIFLLRRWCEAAERAYSKLHSLVFEAVRKYPVFIQAVSARLFKGFLRFSIKRSMNTFKVTFLLSINDFFVEFTALIEGNAFATYESMIRATKNTIIIWVTGNVYWYFCMSVCISRYIY